jgi:UDP:flavonoid glycosyltransferase YjiC (YdhE family)
MEQQSCVLIAMQPEPGHVMPTFAVAEALMAAGHSVVYLTSMTLAAHLKERGFLAEPFATTQGHLPQSHAAYDVMNSGRSYWQQFGHGAVRAEFIDTRVREFARKYRPSLILADHLFFRNHKLFPSCEVNGVPVVHVATSMPRWDEPEIDSSVPRWVLCPADLELRCFLDDYRNIEFAEPSIDWNRREVAFSSANLRHGKALILYSPGTQMVMHVNANERLCEVLTAAKAIPDCDFVIATGTNVVGLLETPVPSNVTIAPHIPQLTLLRRASLLITHGGLGSIKEALCCGVPLLTTPVVFDQPYNAMRVRKKSLGAAIFPNEMTSANLKAAIESVRDSSLIRSSVQAMRERFLAQENARPFSRTLIERISHLC